MEQILVHHVYRNILTCDVDSSTWSLIQDLTLTSVKPLKMDGVAILLLNNQKIMLQVLSPFQLRFHPWVENRTGQKGMFLR